MHWDLRQARTFIAVAETLSFSGAAQRLNIAQSAISRVVAEMEADLRVPLLSRTTRSVALTPAGRLLLNECREVVAHFDRWTRRARRFADGTAGSISIASNDFAFQAEVPRLLRRFRATYPEVAVRFYNKSRDVVLGLLDSGEVEVGFVMGPITHPRYQTTISASYRMMCLVHRGHRFAKRESVAIEELAEEPLILGQSGWRAYRNFIDRAFETAAKPLRVSYEVEDSVVIYGLVASGYGITLYPDCHVHVRPADVVSIPITGFCEEIQTVAVWLERQLSPAGRNFVKLLLARNSAP